MSKVKIVLGALAIVGLTAPSALAVSVLDPAGPFTDTAGNRGYAEVDPEGGAVRLCNENEGTPAGDELTGYIWVDSDGDEAPASETASIGYAGAGDADGEAAEGDPNTNDCPTPSGAVN